jgi:hypothetical protein
MHVDIEKVLTVMCETHDPEPEGQEIPSHQYLQLPSCALPYATQASLSPHSGAPPTAAHLAPTPPGPDVMHDQVFPSTDQQVCPAGQSYVVAQPWLSGAEPPQATARSSKTHANQKARMPPSVHAGRHTSLVLEMWGPRAYKSWPAMDYQQAEQVAGKRFSAEDKAWTGPRFVTLAIITLGICVSAIYFMSTMSGCSLQIVPF